MENPKKKTLECFINKFKYLPEQRSKEWLDNRKYSIGGSEMGIIAGYSPYKGLRDLIENHLGITEFNGNINTYWGSIIEDLVTNILEKKWNCKIYETGSLPGVIACQKYSPDGLVYLDFLDKIVLIEIKSAARRIANGKIPRMYKPQIYTGLDTIPIADMGLFVDALFRRCPVEDFVFSEKYDTEIHPDKPLGLPIALCSICMYEDLYSTDYDTIKEKYGKDKNGWIDAGNIPRDDLEKILSDTSDGKLKFFIPSFIDDSHISEEEIQEMFVEFESFVKENNFEPVAVMPLKLFKLELIPVGRDDWRKKYNRQTKEWYLSEEIEEKSFVQVYQPIIEKVVNQIMILDKLSPEEQLRELDRMYPQYFDIPEEVSDDIIKSLIA